MFSVRFLFLVPTAVRRRGFLPVLAGLLATAPGAVSAQPITLDAVQRTALGLRFTAVAPARDQLLPAIARVVVPPTAQAVVAAPAQGVLTALEVAIGDSVRAGQTLGRYASPPLIEGQRALNEARSQAALASAALVRDQALFDEGIVSAARLEATRARSVQARDAVAAREAELAASGAVTRPGAGAGMGLALSAPLAGVVVQVPGAIGERSDAGAILFRISRPDRLELDATTTFASPRIPGGSPVKVVGRDVGGVVLASLPLTDGTVGQRLRVRIDGGTEVATLAAGEVLAVQVGLPAAGPGTPLNVPSRAITRWQGRHLVFVETADGVEAVVVAVGRDDGETTLVTGGLAAGMRIAIGGVAALKGRLTEGAP